MKSWPADLLAALANPASNVSACVDLHLPSGTTYRFTNSSCRITVGGYDYFPGLGMIPTAVASDRTLQPSTMEIKILTGTTFPESLFLNGDVEGALVDAFWVDRDHLATSKGYIFKGWRAGKTSRPPGDSESLYSIEIRSRTTLLQRQIVDLTSETCRARFGDERCKLDTTSLTVTGSVTSVGTNGRRSFVDSSRTETGDVYARGDLTWTSGANVGRTVQIESFDPAAKRFLIFRMLPYRIQVGDAYRVVQGCARTRAACVTYGNMLNFHGEPDVPKGDELKINYGRPARRRSPWER